VSFRARLTLFFFLIVVIPMAVVAALVVGVTNASRNGKADARLDGGVHAALTLYRTELTSARAAAVSVAESGAVQDAVRSGDGPAIQAAASSAATGTGASSVVVRGPGKTVTRVGPPGIAVSRVALKRPGGGTAAAVYAAATDARVYVAKVHRLTGLDTAVIGPRGRIAGTAPFSGGSLPDNGKSGGLTVQGKTLRATTARLPGAGDLELAMIAPVTSGGFFSSQPAVAAAFAGFLAIALILVALILRALSGQVKSMLGAARRIGQGDFSGDVPVLGHDEMAGLAEEFNKMSDRLSAQIGQLRSQRDEIERSVQRIGEAFASGLDRSALLEIVAETAISACNATYGVIALGGRVGDEVEAGDATMALRDAIAVAEERATRGGELAEHCSGGACALAAPIARLGEAEPVGVMSVARPERSFEPAERDVFRYLVGQAATSIENIALHELVSEQAVTDDLTGLSNKRRFRDLVTKEAARAERFGHPLSLLILDIDDFKRVNDTHGHPQGDEVLRRIARALDSESRWVDEPARYGGEEFAIALPETGQQGAVEVGERVRSRIEAEEIPLVSGKGTIKVTASIGMATLPGSANDVETLVAAADAALYESKRAGKNRVTAAERPPVDRRAPKAAKPTTPA
jgi:diguanylate cyclase (GGDEF)-like protein